MGWDEKVKGRMRWDGTGWDGTGYGGSVERSEMKLCEDSWSGVVWSGVEWSGVVWAGLDWCGVVWCGVVVCCGVVWCRYGMKCNTETIRRKACVVQAALTGGNNEAHADETFPQCQSSFFLISYPKPPKALLSNCDQE